MASFRKEQFKHKSTLSEFAEFIYDRQKSWHNRFVKKIPYPWSDNKIIKKYKFCNVYRELDRCSVYLINKIIDNENLSNANKIFNIFIFRIFNQDELFDKYFSNPMDYKNFDFNKSERELDLAKSKGLNVFNSAYNITQRTYCDEYRKREKYVQHLLNFQNIAKNKFEKLVMTIENCLHVEEAFHKILQLNFFGPFLAYQCLIDISYIKEFKFLDMNSFVQVGPGAKGGIDAISLSGKSLNYEEDCKKVYSMQEEMFYRLKNQTGKNWMLVNYPSPYNKGDYLSLNNIQNCFCEFRKYLNYKSGVSMRKKFFRPKEDVNGLQGS